LICVVFPLPSPPSKEMKYPGFSDMAAINRL
jgi:hypothetical protein